MSADIYIKPSACEHCGRSDDSIDVNLTYNLTPMLREAGMPAWSEMVGMTTDEAGPIWRRVHAALVAEPNRFRALNPPNGWGTYEGAVDRIDRLATACEQHPGGRVDGWL